ncbi:MAG TPA: hypothetical protein VMB82_01010 [Acidimicrobiales bacterium]|nr:hypothetical protein [Acidimicrobiales bacterium]
MASASGSPHRYQTNQRDEAFDRVRRTTRWVVASAVLGTGALVGVVAQELPAHSVTAKSTGTARSTGTTNGTSGTSGTGSASTGTGSSSGSATGSSTAGSTTGTASTSTSGSSVSKGTQQSAHAVTGQS